MSTTQNVTFNIGNAFYTNNIRNKPQCGVMTFLGQNVAVSSMHFDYSGSCKNESSYSDRIPIRTVSAKTGTSTFEHISCNGCFAPVGIFPGNLESLTPVLSVDTAGTVITSVSSHELEPWAGKYVAVVCGNCLNSITINIDSDQMVWWTSTMHPGGNPTLFNISEGYFPASETITKDSIKSEGASEEAVKALIALVVLFIGVVILMFILELILYAKRNSSIHRDMKLEPQPTQTSTSSSKVRRRNK